MRLLAISWAILTASCCEPNDGEQDPALDGILDQPFHREGMVDATNLVIKTGGTMRWRIFGCDFEGGDEAPWRADGGSVVVEPDDGDAYSWIGDIGVLDGVARITLTPADDGEVLAVRITFSSGQPAVDQQWIRGGICAQCGGSLGPTGLEPCDDPFTDYR